jgi:hypothetical protein
MPDSVNHPAHYTQGGIECIKAIEASMSPEGFQDYCKGNVLKYIWRWRDKAGVEDLEKAQVYLGWMIESAKKNKHECNKLESNIDHIIYTKTDSFDKITDLVKDLRICGKSNGCKGCSRENKLDCCNDLESDAANTIEFLCKLSNVTGDLL